MQRRRVIQSLLAMPAAAAVPVAAQPPARAVEETPKTPTTGPDAVASGMAHFFSEESMAALRRLAQLIMPRALEANVPEFLDFLISQSPQDRQLLYREGFDALDRESRRRFGKPFAGVAPAQAETVLAPLRAPWTYSGPSDPLGKFLVAAKADIIEGTVSSREWAESAGRGRRSAAGMNTYWYPVES